MKALIKRKKYNSGIRPSEHRISKEGFLKDNSGAIPSNVISLPNTNSKDRYLCYCKQNGLKHHPARMPSDLAKFFIDFLTEPGDLILDPFGGSNVTGFVAEQCGRRWRSVEMDSTYAESSISRFESAWKVSRKNHNLGVDTK
jgi:site-specific DNA-methyltransferase (cytosine-N4-specific)